MTTDINNKEIKEGSTLVKMASTFGTFSIDLPAGTKGIVKDGVVQWENGLKSSKLRDKKYFILGVI